MDDIEVVREGLTQCGGCGGWFNHHPQCVSGNEASEAALSRIEAQLSAVRKVEQAARDVDYFNQNGDPEPLNDALLALHAALKETTDHG